MIKLDDQTNAELLKLLQTIMADLQNGTNKVPIDKLQSFVALLNAVYVATRQEGK